MKSWVDAAGRHYAMPHILMAQPVGDMQYPFEGCAAGLGCGSVRYSQAWCWRGMSMIGAFTACSDTALH
jgi:hypothetical protein